MHDSIFGAFAKARSGSHPAAGRISVFHRPSFVMETTKTTFKNNLVLRAHLEHSHFQNRYSLWIGKW
ncbi:MAG: hypothetical protein IJ658_08785, partial [Kiritimatiellae bacterium]|nr:hypothetical protein [Kiritimatiellia bacterium]